MKEYVIYVKNQGVIVTKEVFDVYYKMKNREKYVKEVSLRKNLSYEALVEDNFPVEEKMTNREISTEDFVISKVVLKDALNNLTKYERMIIFELIVKGTSIRELSEKISVSKSTLHNHKKSIIKKLKKFLKNI